MKNDCPYNAGITCPPNKRRCATCGWAPEEARRRAEEEAKRQDEGRAPVQAPKRHTNHPKRVAKVNRHGQVVQVYSSVRMAAMENGLSRDVVRNRCEGRVFGRTLDLGGYTFRYLKD